MAEYKVVKKGNKKKIGRKKYTIVGFEMAPKMKKHTRTIDIDKVVVVKPEMQELSVKQQFQITYRKLFRMIMELLESDSTDGDIQIALTEVEKMKKIIQNKYKRIVKQEEFMKMWNKTILLEKQLKERLLLMQLFSLPEERKGRGR